MVSFNSMIDSLENEKGEVRSLIHQLKESEALFRSQFEFGNIGIAITSVDKGWVVVPMNGYAACWVTARRNCVGRRGTK